MGEGGRPPPTRRPGLALLPLPLCFVALVLTLAASGPGVLPGDVAVARWVQATDGAVADDLARLVWVIGNGPAIWGVGGALTVLLLTRRRWWLAAAVIGVVAVRSLNPLFKRLVGSPRPTDDLVRVTERASELGFPSGHAIGVTLLFGAVFVVAGRLIRRRWLRRAAQGAALFVVLLTGWGRVYVGAHWPSDVLGGYLWGLTLLLFITQTLPALRRRLPRGRLTARRRVGERAVTSGEQTSQFR